MFLWLRAASLDGSKALRTNAIEAAGSARSPTLSGPCLILCFQNTTSRGGALPA